VHGNVTKSPDKNRNCESDVLTVVSVNIQVLQDTTQRWLVNIVTDVSEDLPVSIFIAYVVQETPKTEKAGTPRTSVTICQSTRCIPEGSFLETRSYECKQAATDDTHKKNHAVYNEAIIKTWKNTGAVVRND
jgi:hypothetical protein